MSSNVSGTNDQDGVSWYAKELCTKALKPDQRPNHLEILLPPIAILVLIISGIAGLALSSYLNSKKFVQSLKYMQTWFEPPYIEHTKDTRKNNNKNKIDAIEQVLEGDRFYSPFDIEVLKDVKNYYNRPKKLIMICIPAFVSLIMTALIMFIYQPIASCLWPVTGRPDINTAITCFMMPAGLVYALSFGFTIQQVMEKQRRVMKKITNELSMMDQLATMAQRMNLPTNRHEMSIYKAIKSEAIFLAMLVQKREPSSFVNEAPKNIKVHVWSIIDILRDAASHPEYNFNLNRILVDKMVDYLIQINDICADKMGSLHSQIHPFTWIFLEVLGGLVLLGIMLIDASSRQMELTMCELTIFSVSMLCYVLADLDTPFNGFFRVQLDVLPDVLARLEYLYNVAESKQICKTAL